MTSAMMHRRGDPPPRTPGEGDRPEADAPEVPDEVIRDFVRVLARLAARPVEDAAAWDAP